MTDQLIWGAAVFFGLLVVLRRIFVVWRPRSQIFWKRADYVYFSFAVVGVVVGITDSVQNDLRLEAENLFARRTEIYRGLFVEVYATQRYCSNYDQARELEEQREVDKRYGVIRPTEEIPEKRVTTLGFLPYYITPEDCAVANELHDAMIQLQAPAAKKLGLAYANEFSRPLSQMTYNSDQHEGWSREIILMVEQLQGMDSLEKQLSAKLGSIAWSGRFSDWWPVLLAAALAIRIVKVHAEIKLVENGKKGD